MSNTRGLAGILRNMNAYSRELKRDLTLEVFRATTKIEGTAKSKVVVDTGKLKQSIYHRMDYAKATGQVGATEFYAPFIEFGTGGNVSIPNGFADFASEFKGAGVRTINRSAQPFLIPAFLEETQKLKEEIKKTVTRYSGRNRR
jgi:HK97 gp10 family phage protein